MKKFNLEFIRDSYIHHRNRKLIYNRHYHEYKELLQSFSRGLFDLLVGKNDNKKCDKIFFSEDYLDMQEQLIAEYRGLI